MNTINHAFQQITEYTWLLDSFQQAHKEHRYTPEYLEFSQNLDGNLLEIQRQVREGTFKFGPYRRHWVYVPKKRLVMALPPESRVVQWAIYGLLNPYYDRIMIEDSYACRVGKGSLAAAHRLQYFLRLVESKPDEYAIIKADISKFFYRIDHEKLKEILQRRIRDKDLMALLGQIIDCDGDKFGLPRFTHPDEVPFEDWLGDVGMPIGNLTSQLFANIYLNELDQFCKHVLRVRYFVRYMDDVIMVVPRKRAHEVLDAAEKFLLEELRLDLNKKTTIQPVGKVEFVGYIVSSRKLTFRRQTTQRIKSAFGGICKRYFAGELTGIEFSRRVETYRGMMLHCEADNLRKRLNEIYLREKERAKVSNLQIIETLSEIVEKQNRIIRKQAEALAQLGAACLEEETKEVNGLVEFYLGKLEE